MVVEETWRTGGFAGEIVSAIQEQAFDHLDGPVGRVGGIDVPAPYNGKLERAAFPYPERVVRAVEHLYGI